MADLFVAGGGSNTAPYETWAKAATTLATALAAATGDGDRVIIDNADVPAGDKEVAANTTWSAAANIQIIAATNDGGSAFTPAAMGTATWLGNSTTARIIIFDGGFSVLMYGVTIRTASTSAANMTINNSDAGQYELDTCYLWQGSTQAGSRIFLGASSSTTNQGTRCRDVTFRFGSTSQGLTCRSAVRVIGGSVSTAGSAPDELFKSAIVRGPCYMTGVDLSHVTGTLLGNIPSGALSLTLENCKLASGVVRIAAQTNATSANEVIVINCDSGDNHYLGEHHNALGSTVVSASIYANDGPSYDGTNRYSLLVTSTAAARYWAPYVSPWFGAYHSGTSAITPRIEVLRDGSATAWNDDQLWGEWSYQGTTGFTLATLVNDRRALTASAAAQVTGTLDASGWTGENATAWFGKLTPLASITPAEIGALQARIACGPSVTVYVDPQLRDAA